MINLTCSSLTKTKFKEVNLNLIQNLSGTVTLKSLVQNKKKLNILVYKKETIINLYNKILDINPCTGIGTSIMINAPPMKQIKTSPNLSYLKNKLISFHNQKILTKNNNGSSLYSLTNLFSGFSEFLSNETLLFYNGDPWENSWGEQWYDIYNEDYIYDEDDENQEKKKEEHKNENVK